MAAMDAHLHISAAARQLGVSIKALRLYEQRGLLAPARNAAGYRIYSHEALARAVDVVALRRQGLGLADVARTLQQDPPRRLGEGVAFDLPWPWGGERFELLYIRALNYIVGPLGSGKTRLAMALADALPGGVFLGLDRLDGSADPLAALRRGLSSPGPVVVDLVEQGLDAAAQRVLIDGLRARVATATRPLFLMTRSTAILDLAAVGPDEQILFCPANHSPPVAVAARVGAPGYEAMASCLASPEVRARTAGMVAWQRQA